MVIRGSMVKVYVSSNKMDRIDHTNDVYLDCALAFDNHRKRTIDWPCTSFSLEAVIFRCSLLDSPRRRIRREGEQQTQELTSRQSFTEYHRSQITDHRSSKAQM